MITLSNFFVKFANQNSPSVRIFVFKETTKFVFTLQDRQFAYILLQKVLNCKPFSCIWKAFWPPNPQWGSLQCSPVPPHRLNYSLNFCVSLLKRSFEPCTPSESITKPYVFYNFRKI